MRAIKELGLLKTFKYLVLSLVMLLYHLIIDHLIPFFPARILFFKLLGAKIGRDSVIMNVKFFNLHHTGFGGLSIGKECFIGDETLIDLYGRVLLEDQVTLAQRVTVLTHLNVGYSNHPLQGSFPRKSQPVVFKKGSVVGAASVILPGVTIGENSFVAAGSVVTKNVAASTLVAGVPAKPVRPVK